MTEQERYEAEAAGEALNTYDVGAEVDAIFADYAEMVRRYYAGLVKPECPFPDAIGATAPEEPADGWGDPLADR
jgi:hypothetical protein